MKYCAGDNINVHIGDELVKEAFVTIFLGVLSNEHFNWKDHIRMIKSKLSRRNEGMWIINTLKTSLLRR